MKQSILLAIAFALTAGVCYAGTIQVKKNQAYEIKFTMLDTAAPESFKSCTVTDDCSSRDGASAWATLAITDAVSEILTDDWYAIELTAAEMNHDQIVCKFTCTGGADNLVVIDTYAVDIEDLVRATTPANTLDVTATGAAGIDWGNVENTSTAVDLSGTDFQLVDTVTTYTGNTLQTADVNGVPTIAEFNARTLVAAAYFDASTDTVANVTTVATLSGHTAQTGDSFARIGAAGAGLTAIADITWDEVLTGASHNVSTSAGRRLRALEVFGGYEAGAVWIDTVDGVAGTEDFENGTVNNPVDSLVDAKIIADSVGLHAFRVDPGSSVVLTAATAFDDFEFNGSGYTVDLNGQSVSGTIFVYANIIGNDDGSNTDATVYRFCKMNTNTLGLHRLVGCGLRDEIIIAEAGTYDWVNSVSLVAGTSSPSVDVGSSIANTNVNIRNYSGGIEVKNSGVSGTDNMTIEGNGQVILNANCTGGVVCIRGNFNLTDNSGGSVTIVDDARFTLTGVNAEADTALADYDGPTDAEMIARTLLSASYFDPATDTVANVTTVASVTAVATGGITAASIAADAIGASELAADGITEMTDDIFAEVVDGKSFRSIHEAEMALLLGISTFNGSTTGIFKKNDGTTTKITFTYSGDGNRTAAVWDDD